MAIVKMSKFSLFALDSHREELLHELQKFEYVHFDDLNQDESLKELGLESVEIPESVVAVDEDITKAKYIIDILSQYDSRQTGIMAMKEGLETFTIQELENYAKDIEIDSIYESVKTSWEKKESINQEIDNLKTFIEELKPWVGLETPVSDIKGIKDSIVHLGFIPKKLRENLEEDLVHTEYTYFEVISEDKENSYILALTSEEENPKVLEILRKGGFSQVNLKIDDSPGDTISQYNDKINNFKEEEKKYVEELTTLSTKHIKDVEITYDYYSNERLRITSSQNFAKTKVINVIEGYIPTDREEDFTRKVDESLKENYYLELKEAEKDDPNVPVLLKNSKFAEVFESLTTMYALPKYNEIDPTPLLAPFYLLFFGMMAADIGYGLMLLIGTIFVLKKFNLSEDTEKFIRFFYYLSYAILGWGILYGSFFGGIIPLPGLFDPATDYNTLLILSIGFGLIHIFYGLAIQAYMYIRDGQIADAIFDVGFWFMALTGAIIYLGALVVAIPQALVTLGFVIMLVGMLGIVATGGRSAKGIVGKVGGGIYELYGISSYVGDFVSYSRLMALGLSGGFIASSINMMANMVAGKGIIGIIGAIVIFIGGQVFNFGLSLLSAYVHSIRLTFVEFFGKFYEGGGKGFNLFRNKTKYINLK